LQATLGMAIRDRIAAENSFRQKLVHGTWSYDVADPLIVEKPSAGGSTQRLLNGDRIVEFAHRVDQPSMKLVYPNGLSAELVAEMRASGPAFSRNGFRMLMGKDIPK
jgi:hypothetical protein